MQEKGSWGDGFHCACALPKEPLAWRPLAACLTGAASATGGDWPAVCRHRIAHDLAKPFRTGYVAPRRWDNGDYTCFAPDGATSVDSMGLLPHEFEVLCRGGGRREAGVGRREAARPLLPAGCPWRGRVEPSPRSAIPHINVCPVLRPSCPQPRLWSLPVPPGSSSAITAGNPAVSPAWPAARPARPTNGCGCCMQSGRGAAATRPYHPSAPPSPALAAHLAPWIALQVSGHCLSTTVELCSSFIERSSAVAAGTGCPTFIKRNENFDVFDFQQASTSPPTEQDTLCGEQGHAAQQPENAAQNAGMLWSVTACTACLPRHAPPSMQAFRTRRLLCCPRRRTTAHTRARWRGWCLSLAATPTQPRA